MVTEPRVNGLDAWRNPVSKTENYHQRVKGHATWKSCHESICLRTEGCLQFIDLTDLVAEQVRRSGVSSGIVNVQTKHTTTALVVNENEPLLFEDIKKRLQRLAPREIEYRHDDHSARAGVPPDERKNGHAHCKAIFLRTSETLNIVNGSLDLGPWQRIFLVELDEARSRIVSVMILGMECPI